MAGERMRKTYYDCIFFRSSANVFGGCKHPSATSACLYEYTKECGMGRSRIKQGKKLRRIYDKDR